MTWRVIFVIGTWNFVNHFCSLKSHPASNIHARTFSFHRKLIITHPSNHTHIV